MPSEVTFKAQPLSSSQRNFFCRGNREVHILPGCRRARPGVLWSFLVWACPGFTGPFLGGMSCWEARSLALEAAVAGDVD